MGGHKHTMGSQKHFGWEWFAISGALVMVFPRVTNLAIWARHSISVVCCKLLWVEFMVLWPHAAIKSQKQQHTTHVHRKVWQALLIERRKHMPAIWLVALTTRHMCSKHVQFQYKRNSKHGKHAGPISIQ